MLGITAVLMPVHCLGDRVIILQLSDVTVGQGYKD